MLADAELAEGAVAALMGRAEGIDALPSGLARLAALPAFVEHLLVPRLPALLCRYPGLQIEPMTSAAKVDVNRNRQTSHSARSVRNAGDRTRIRRLADFAFGLDGSRSSRDGTPVRTAACPNGSR